MAFVICSKLILSAFQTDMKPPLCLSTSPYSQTSERGMRKREEDGGMKDFICPACLTCPQRSPIGRRSLALLTAVLFSHTVIGRGPPSVKLTSTPGPASASLSRDFIGYCTSSCSAIGRTAWLSRLRGFIHHFATVV